jgi:hypothetical protein
MNIRVSRLLALMLVFGTSGMAYSGPIYDDLLRKLPDTTNVVIAGDVQALRQALGLAKDAAILSPDASGLPVAAKEFVVGAHVDMSERKHLWSIGMARLVKKVTMEDLAKSEGSPVEEVAGYSTVASDRNAFFIDLGHGLLATGTPANRQQLKRWLQFQKTNNVIGIPDYLQDAVNAADKALMVIAVDLSDSLSPAAINRGLNQSETLAKRKNVNYENVAKTLTKVKGLTFVIHAGDPLTAELTIDFSTTTDAVQNFAKAFLLEALERTELSLPDFEEWRPRIKEKSIGIYGPLSVNSLRKINTLIATPAPAAQVSEMDKYSAMEPGQKTVAASKKYFKSVTQLLDDLKEDKYRSVKSLAGWYDKYAGQIEKLPILDVDPELIQYAAATSEGLRAMGASFQGVSLETSYLQRQKTSVQIYQAPQYTGNYSGWNAYGGYFGGYGANLANNAALYRSGTAGGVTTYDNYEQIRGVQDAMVTRSKGARTQLWQQIDNETANMRRKMTLKYKTEF